MSGIWWRWNIVQNMRGHTLIAEKMAGDKPAEPRVLLTRRMRNRAEAE